MSKSRVFQDQAHTPAQDGANVTGNDNTDLPDGICKSLFVGSGGTVVLQMEKSSSILTFQNVPAGSILPFRVRRVLATGTDATGIIALY